MFLRPTDRPPTRHPLGGWAIRMLSESTPVTVRVTDEAIHDAGENIFICRNQLEEIASEKFARHELEPDGSVTVKSDDVTHH